GPAIEEIFLRNFYDAYIKRLIVPDDPEKIYEAFKANLSMDFIITTGGTGISPRDMTPEVTMEFCDRLVPGISEIIRAESYKQTAQAMLSRGVAGIKDHTLIINLPGSVTAVRFCADLLVPVLQHALDMIKGRGH
ncbi:MAG: MogA/MoaB family molybdenum cofactor biosynthesis protein, partial [Elusimicrobiota bacterium]